MGGGIGRGVTGSGGKGRAKGNARTSTTAGHRKQKQEPWTAKKPGKRKTMNK